MDADIAFVVDGSRGVGADLYRVALTLVDAVLDELEVTNVATMPDLRRRGVGRALVNALLGYAREENFRRVTLEVRESNAPAIALYESLGFTPCGLRKNFYTQPSENAIIYEVLI